MIIYLWRHGHRNGSFLFVTLNETLTLYLSLVVNERPILSEEEQTDSSFIHGCSKNVDMEFRPKYKYYEDLKDYRRDREVVLRLRQSPGVKRRKDKAKLIQAKATVVKLLPDERGHYNSFA